MSDTPVKKLPRSVFDTRNFTRKRALSEWHENIGVMFDVRVRDPDDPLSYSRIDAFMLGDVMLVDGHTGAQSYDRSQRRIARDGVDHYLLQFYLSGSVGRRDGKDERARTRPGDVWITDLAQPLSSVAETADTVNLFVPRRILAPLLNAPDEYSMAILDGRRPLVTLLRNHLQAVLKEAPSMTTDEALAVITPTLELAASALNGVAREEAHASIEGALRDEVCRYVRSAPRNEPVTREAAARCFNISLRKLDYLFQPLGGFARWVRYERLAQARLMLADPNLVHMRIDEIAAANGFSHATHFVRAFRNHYDMTPGLLRALARERHLRSDPASHASNSSWQYWIRKL
jgi:AraC-like DNA-binding protein